MPMAVEPVEPVPPKAPPQNPPTSAAGINAIMKQIPDGPCVPPPHILEGMQLPEKELFWETEVWARLRNSDPTMHEMEMLSKEATTNKAALKVKTNWGAKKGTGKATRKLIQEMMQKKVFQPGDVVGFRSMDFTIMKHWWMCNADPWTSRMDKDQSVKCFCCPYTSFMPNGCYHKPGPMWCDKQYMPWCESCSKCMRCGKYPGVMSDVVCGGGGAHAVFVSP